MAHGKSIELASFGERNHEWIVRHEVQDRLGRDGRYHPQPANRAEERAAQRGKPWYGNPLPSRMVVHAHPVNPAGGNR